MEIPRWVLWTIIIGFFVLTAVAIYLVNTRLVM